MRWTGLLVVASGCLQTTVVDFAPDPRARTTLLITRSYGFAIDRTAEEAQRDLPLSFGEDERVFMLDYSQPVAGLQLEAGVIYPDPSGDRDLPPADLSAKFRDFPLEDNKWMETDEMPEFKLPPFAVEKCAEDGLCLVDPDAPNLSCTVCTSTSPPELEIAPPARPNVTGIPEHLRCDPGSAHFFMRDGCESVTSRCPATPPGAIGDRDTLQSALAGTSTSVVLAPGVTIGSETAAIIGPKVVNGCGSAIVLDPGTALSVREGEVRFQNIRIEGGVIGIEVLPSASAIIEHAAISGPGQVGIRSYGSVEIRDTAISARRHGIQILGGVAVVERTNIQDGGDDGVGCHAGTATISALVMNGTPTNPTGRGFLVATGCNMTMRGVLIERGLRIAIEAFDPATTVSVSNLTIRNIANSTGEVTGGLHDRGSSEGTGARYPMVEKVWIEGVPDVGIHLGDANTVIRDVHVEGVFPALLPPATGVRLVLPAMLTGTATLDRIEVVRLAGRGIYLEKVDYHPRTKVELNDVLVDSGGSNQELVIAKSVDAHFRRMRLVGGAEGLHFFSGSQSTLEQVEIEDTARYGLNLEAGVDTRLEAKDLSISGCNDGLRVALGFGETDERAMHLKGERISVSDCVQYGMVFELVEVAIDRFLVEESSIGINVGKSMAFNFARGIARRNDLGARVVSDDDLRRLLTGVHFTGNRRGIEVIAP